MLRRILFPIIAYPFVRAAGFLTGGVIASILIHLLALAVFAHFVKKRIGVNAAIAMMWLLATYPGITYWAGLPYSYVAIVPGALLCLILLYRIDEASTLGSLLRAAVLMGVLFTGYDLFPFFGTAAVLVLLVRRKFHWLVPVVIALALPSVLIVLMFVAMGLPLLNSNTGNYVAIILAYLNPVAEPRRWLEYLFELPLVFGSNFVFGNLIFLPLLFLGALVLARRRGVPVLTLPEKTLLLATLALFLFSNAAPPYYGWQLRGHWVARLYQPVFPVYLMAIARLTQALTGRDSSRWRAAVALTVAANASIAFGPVLMNPLAAFAYQRFYIHSPAKSLLVNLERYGRRPLGFCSESHQWDYLPNPNKPLNRPELQYRYDETRHGRERRR